ncbi:MAG TPA: hypothetical protein VNY06_07350 [Methylocella sp.]|nr:hypothetical protein [Methylocella sp.]
MGPGYRVYFGRDGKALVILLTGGTKQRQPRDMERAKALWADYKRGRKPPVSPTVILTLGNAGATR